MTDDDVIATGQAEKTPLYQTAVILAAGLGSRIPRFSVHHPKGLIPIGGMTLIERACRVFFRHRIKNVIVVTGHRAPDYVSWAHRRVQESPHESVVCVHNPHYATTGSLSSLLHAAPHVKGAFLLAESDLLFEERAAADLLAQPANTVLVSGVTGAGDEVWVGVDDSRRVVAMSKKPEDLASVTSAGELVGLVTMSGHVLPAFQAFAEEGAALPPMGARTPRTLGGLAPEALQTKKNYEDAIVACADRHPFQACVRPDVLWGEIDDESHFTRAVDYLWPRIQEKEHAAYHS